MLRAQHRENLPELKNLWQSQILQLQQKQRLWLQSQFYVVGSLLDKRSEGQQLQTYLWSYYQRNPDISAISLQLVENDSTQNSSRSCRAPIKTNPSIIDIIPVFASCKIGDQILLEISGPATIQQVEQILTLQMDYFSFMRDFAQLQNLRFEPGETDDDVPVFIDPNYTNSEIQDAELVIRDDGVDRAVVKMHLSEFDFEPSNLRTVIILVALLTLLLMAFALILYIVLLKPLNRLSNRMYDAGLTNLEDLKERRPPLETGLDSIFRSFKILLDQAKHDATTGLEKSNYF